MQQPHTCLRACTLVPSHPLTHSHKHTHTLPRHPHSHNNSRKHTHCHGIPNHSIYHTRKRTPCHGIPTATASPLRRTCCTCTLQGSSRQTCGRHSLPCPEGASPGAPSPHACQSQRRSRHRGRWGAPTGCWGLGPWTLWPWQGRAGGVVGASQSPADPPLSEHQPVPSGTIKVVWRGRGRERAS